MATKSAGLHTSNCGLATKDNVLYLTLIQFNQPNSRIARGIHDLEEYIADVFERHYT